MKITSFKIGKRLVAAFSVTTLITLIVGGIAFHTWNTLGNQIAQFSERSIPVLTATHQLERASARIQSLLDKTSTTNDLEQHRKLTLEMNDALASIARATTQSQGIFSQDETTPDRLSALRSSIEKHNVIVQQQIELNQQLSQTYNRISWLHQDLNDEFAPLLQEVEWHINQLISTPQSGINGVIREFAILQAIQSQTRELIDLVDEIVSQRYQRDLDTAFRFIAFKTNNLQQEQNELKAYPSTITHRQILENIIKLVQPGGELYQRIKRDIEINRQLSLNRYTLNHQLAGYHHWVSELVNNANDEITRINQATKSMVTRSQTQIALLVTISLVTSVLVLVLLIGRKLVHRLNTLSDELDAVTSGNVDAPITISGNDEIGRLGDTLRVFCQQVKEIERTNALNLINNTQVALITCHPNGTIETVNPSARKLFGRQPTDASTTLWELTDGEGRDKLKALFTESHLLGKEGRREYTLAVRVGEALRYLTFHFHRFTQNPHWKFIVTVTDMTRQELTARQLSELVDQKTNDLKQQNLVLEAEVDERKRMQSKLVDAQDDLIQAAKMAVVGQAMTSLAHELNQPLAAISNYLYTGRLACQMNQQDGVLESFGKIEKLSLRMSRIISDLRQFARKSPPSPQAVPCDLHQVTNSAFVLIESRAKNERITTTNHLPNALYVMADEVNLEQVLVNLMVNSADALAGNTVREIEVSLLENTPSATRIAVSDSGTGFPAGMVDQLFIPFSTTKDVGLGLGLSICRSILNRFNATIHVASTVQGGAMVVLEFNHEHCNRAPQEHIAD